MSLRKKKDIKETYSASGIEQSFSLLNLATTSIKKTVKALDRHPEKRVKAEYKKYEETQMIILKKEYKTLKHSQIIQLIEKMWKKAKENPMNQQNISYNEKKKDIEEKVSQTIEEDLNYFL